MSKRRAASTAAFFVGRPLRRIALRIKLSSMSIVVRIFPTSVPFSHESWRTFPLPNVIPNAVRDQQSTPKYRSLTSFGMTDFEDDGETGWVLVAVVPIEEYRPDQLPYSYARRHRNSTVYLHP